LVRAPARVDNAAAAAAATGPSSAVITASIASCCAPATHAPGCSWNVRASGDASFMAILASASRRAVERCIAFSQPPGELVRKPL